MVPRDTRAQSEHDAIKGRLWAACPLSQIQAGTVVRVEQLAAATDVCQRLRELGLGEGRTMKLLSTSVALVCIVCAARLALSAQLAASIMVTPCREAAPG
jgi:ferrous iron transport protein A